MPFLFFFYYGTGVLYRIIVTIWVAIIRYKETEENLKLATTGAYHEKLNLPPSER